MVLTFHVTSLDVNFPFLFPGMLFIYFLTSDLSPLTIHGKQMWQISTLQSVTAQLEVGDYCPGTAKKLLPPMKVIHGTLPFTSLGGLIT